MDPRLMPSLGPVARAIDGIRIVCYVNMTLLDRMDFFLLKTGIETYDNMCNCNKCYNINNVVIRVMFYN